VETATNALFRKATTEKRGHSTYGYTYTILLPCFSLAIFTVKVVFVRLDHLANLSKLLCSTMISTQY
jgi:hypothetical protein